LDAKPDGFAIVFTAPVEHLLLREDHNPMDEQVSIRRLLTPADQGVQRGL
jgi:hypothetical protein